MLYCIWEILKIHREFPKTHKTTCKQRTASIQPIVYKQLARVLIQDAAPHQLETFGECTHAVSISPIYNDSNYYVISKYTYSYIYVYKYADCYSLFMYAAISLYKQINCSVPQMPEAFIVTCWYRECGDMWCINISSMESETIENQKINEKKLYRCDKQIITHKIGFSKLLFS